MFTFDSENDYGPYRWLFDSMQGWNVKIETTTRPQSEAMVASCGSDAVTVRLWVDGDQDEASGTHVVIPYENITALVVY